MKSVLLAITFTSTFAMAETGTFTVKGMHCSGCKEMVTEKVCKGAAAKEATSCEVKIVDSKKELGQVVITTKPGVKIDVAAVEAGLQAADSKYKVAKVDINERLTKDLNETAVAATETAPATETVTTMTTETMTNAKGKVVKTQKTKKIVKKLAKRATTPAANGTTNNTETTTTAPAPATTETK